MQRVKLFIAHFRNRQINNQVIEVRKDQASRIEQIKVVVGGVILISSWVTVGISFVEKFKLYNWTLSLIPMIISLLGVWVFYDMIVSFKKDVDETIMIGEVPKMRFLYQYLEWQRSFAKTLIFPSIIFFFISFYNSCVEVYDVLVPISESTETWNSIEGYIYCSPNRRGEGNLIIEVQNQENKNITDFNGEPVQIITDTYGYFSIDIDEKIYKNYLIVVFSQQKKITEKYFYEATKKYEEGKVFYNFNIECSNE